MRQYWIAAGCALLIITSTSRLQAQNTLRVVHARPLPLSPTKTSHLVFPYPIRSADRGSRDILAEVAEGTANVLRVKAAHRAFPQSDLTVITTDGTLYSFLVDYDPDPDTLTWVFSGRQNTPGVAPSAVLRPGGRPSAKTLREDAVRAIHDPREIHGARDAERGRIIRLNGLYRDQGTFFLRIRVENHTALPWQGDPFRFFIRDRRSRKRTAAQRQEIRPCYRWPDSTRIAAQGSREFVFAFAPRHLGPRQCWIVLFTEKNGGTPLRLRISSRTLEKMVPLLPHHPPFKSIHHVSKTP